MPAYRNDVDPFKDIRVLPREAAQLRHHLSRIHHTMQKRYFVSPELSEFALQPDKSDEFIAHYKEEIQRIFAKLNKNSKYQYSVNVDPLRLTTGFEFKRVAGDGDRETDMGHMVPLSQSFASAEAESRWMASMVETGKQLAQQQTSEAHRAALAATLQSTPASQQTQMLRSGATGVDGASTGVVDSDVRKVNKESFLFSTPPEFKGFAPSGASPSETLSPQ